MAIPSVIDLLAQQPDEVLARMKRTAEAERDRLQAELARVTVEAQQIEQAITKKGRGQRTGGGKVTRQQVYENVVAAGTPLTAAEVRERLANDGLEVTVNAIRNHLQRLVEENRTLQRDDSGRFSEAPDDASASDEDIPF